MSQKQRYLPVFLDGKVKTQKQKLEKWEDQINSPDSQGKKWKSNLKTEILNTFTSEVTKMVIKKKKITLLVCPEDWADV